MLLGDISAETMAKGAASVAAAGAVRCRAQGRWMGAAAISGYSVMLRRRHHLLLPIRIGTPTLVRAMSAIGRSGRAASAGMRTERANLAMGVADSSDFLPGSMRMGTAQSRATSSQADQSDLTGSTSIATEK